MSNIGDKPKYPLPLKKKVWAKAAIVPGHPGDIWRRDRNGNAIHWQEYGKINSKYGWKIINANPANDADIEHLHPVHHSVTEI